MKTYFKLELKKALLSWKTIISMIAALILLSIPYLNEIKHPFMDRNGISYFIVIYQRSYIGIISPVIIGLIYSTSIINDMESGFFNKLLEVIDLKTYYKVKLIVNSIITFAIFAVSHGILILHLIVRFGIKYSDDKGMSIGTFSNIYHNSKIAYVMLVILFVSISAVAFSTFVLGITTAFGKKLIAYLFPAFYVVITSVIFGSFSLNRVFNFDITRLFNLNYGAKPLNIIIYDLILTTIGLLLIYKYGYKKELSSCLQC